MFCHVVAKRPAPLCSPLDGNTEAALPTVGVSYGCRENDHKPSCCKQHRLISFGFWGSGVSSGSQGFSPSGGTREQSVSSPGPASWPRGPPSLQHLLGWTHLFSTSDPPASPFHSEPLWGDVGPIASAPHLIRKIPASHPQNPFCPGR